MIDTFSRVILTRKNGEQSKIEYKRPRKCTNDALVAICNRFKIQMPEWNELSQEFEFDDHHYYGDKNHAPETLELLDALYFPIETVESD